MILMVPSGEGEDAGLDGLIASHGSDRTVGPVPSGLVTNCVPTKALLGCLLGDP